MARRSQRARREAIARADANVKYGPQIYALGSLLDEARGTLTSDLGAADAASRSAIRAAERAELPLREIYATARGSAQTADRLVQQNLAGLGSAADPFRAALIGERTGENKRLTGASSAALADLESRKLDAQAGRQYARTQARADYRQTKNTLNQRLGELLGEQGSYEASRIGELGEAAAGRKATTRVQRLRQRADERAATIKHRRDKELVELKDSLKNDTASSFKPATRAELRSFTTELEKTRRNAFQLRKYQPATKDEKGRPVPAQKPLTRAQAEDVLMRGQTGADPLPATRDTLALRAALDLVYDGHIARDTARQLKRAGVRVADIPNAVSYTDWRRRSEEARRGH